MNWIEFSIQVDRESAEAVTEIFHRFGQGGVAIEEVTVMGYGKEPEIQSDQPVIVKVYLPEDENISEKRQQIVQAISYLSMIRQLPNLLEKTVPQEDWEQSWKDQFHVHRPGDRTVIVPSWQQYKSSESDIVINLDPGMAFGTGLHPTTQLCIRELEKRVQPSMNLLDVGTGSGILAILSAKLGAQNIVALDVDPMAVERAMENISLNAVDDVIEVGEGSLPLANQDFLHIERDKWASGAFDIVVANILAHVIAELAPAIMTALKPNGVAICSGIITDGFSHALTALTDHGATLVDATSQGDWRALVVTKKS
jgi:ribosomal protein L11 methyltransferase